MRHPPELKGAFEPYGRLDKASNYRWNLGQAGRTRELAYTLQEGNEAAELDTRLTYLAETSVPVKRILTICEDVGRPRSVITETYSKFARDDTVWDDEFRLPEKPK